MNRDGENGDPRGEDLGDPVAELAELREVPREGFLQRIRGSIHRRLLVADTLDFSLMALFRTLFEYLEVLVQSLSGSPRRRGE